MEHENGIYAPTNPTRKVEDMGTINPHLFYEPEQLVCSVLGIPLKIKVSKKNIVISYNRMKTSHYRVHMKVRNYLQQYAFDNIDQQRSVKTGKKVKLLFVYFSPDKRKRDLSNMCVYIDKHVTDALVKMHVIPDDDVNHLINVHYHYGGINKGQHFVDLYCLLN